MRSAMLVLSPDKMKIDLHLFNCCLLIIPLLGWNLILGPRFIQKNITSDAYSPAWLLTAENITRIFVFALPLLIPLQMDHTWGKAGLIVYLIGTLIYFASWLPFLLAPDVTWCNTTASLLAPRLTPFIPFLGIALIGQCWTYGFLSAVFIALHTWHGIQNILFTSPCS